MSRRRKKNRGGKRRARRAPANEQRASPPARPFDGERFSWLVHELVASHPSESVAEIQTRVDALDLTQLIAPDANLPDDPKAQARELGFRALEQTDPVRADELARDALALDPLCTDAHLARATSADISDTDRRAALEEIVRAARSLLGPEAFERDLGDFGRIVTHRPYLRAAASLAQARWFDGDADSAIDLARELVTLDTRDVSEIALPLATWLLLGGQVTAAERTAAEHGDQGASWTRLCRFARALAEGEFASSPPASAAPSSTEAAESDAGYWLEQVEHAHPELRALGGKQMI